MSGTSPQQPMFCLTEAARQSALGANVGEIGFNPAEYAKYQEISGADPEISDLTIVIGGMQKHRYSPITYDPHQQHHIILSPLGERRTVADVKFLPSLIPAQAEKRNLVVCPIPKEWTSAELSALVARNLNKSTLELKETVTSFVGGAVIGAAVGLAATPAIQEAGYEASFPGTALGLSTVGMFAGGLLVVGKSIARGTQHRRIQQLARKLKPFPVYDRSGKLL